MVPGKRTVPLPDGMSEADFLEASRQEDKFTTSFERECQADFYAGAKRLVGGDKNGAVDFFTKCVRLHTIPEVFESYAAAAERNQYKCKDIDGEINMLLASSVMAVRTFFRGTQFKFSPG